MTNNQPKQFEFSASGSRYHVLIDSATMSLVPVEYKVKGQFARYANDAILTMWIQLHKLPDQAGMTRGEMVLAMASDTGSSISAVVRCACAFHAGRMALL